MSQNQPENHIQLQFIAHLKKLIPPNISLVDELADLLQVSNDSIYRRIRGETLLTLDETYKICEHFKISIDALTNQKDNKVSFSYNSFLIENRSFDDYLEMIFNNLKMIHNMGGHITFAAEDIPIFHQFKLKKMAAFKLFYWQKSILNSKELEGKKFDPQFISEKLLKKAEEIFDLYMQIPCTEIWTEETINSTVKQIEYYWEAGLFINPSDAISVCVDMIEMLKQIENQAEKNSKLPNIENNSNENFNMYFSEVMIGNNTILAKTPAGLATFLSFNTFNVIYTQNPEFSTEVEHWIKNHIKKSVLISGVSEKHRYKFFSNVEKVVKKLKEKIEFEMR